MALPPTSRFAGSHSCPDADDIVARLRDLYGEESRISPSLCRWWVHGAHSDTGLALWFDTAKPAPGEPCVVWVTRPSEDRPERCPIETMEHLEAFLAKVSIARRSPAPVHGNVCPAD